jgi:hypothetical protein
MMYLQLRQRALRVISIPYFLPPGLPSRKALPFKVFFKLALSLYSY